MDAPNSFDWLTTAISSILTGTGAWFFTRKKYNAEAQASEIQNVEKAIAIWRQMASEFEGRFKSLQDELLEMNKRIFKLEMENERLELENAALKKEIQEIKN